MKEKTLIPGKSASELFNSSHVSAASRLELSRPTTTHACILSWIADAREKGSRSHVSATSRLEVSPPTTTFASILSQIAEAREKGPSRLQLSLPTTTSASNLSRVADAREKELAIELLSALSVDIASAGGHNGPLIRETPITHPYAAARENVTTTADHGDSDIDSDASGVDSPVVSATVPNGVASSSTSACEITDEALPMDVPIGSLPFPSPCVTDLPIEYGPNGPIIQDATITPIKDSTQ
ncbi:MAG: hypothetical protein ACREHG_04585, partial [Candidatus Saccharimonadales bacterium]